VGDTIDRTGFKFGLPPSLGTEPVWALAREFADLLYDIGFSTVVPYKTYEALHTAVLKGEVDAAWGPPLTCARVEAGGGSVALRAVRGGSTTYRAALVSRSQDTFEISTLGQGAFRPRVVWVEQSSVGGYLLPRAYLRGAGVDIETAFLNQRMLGSYSACIDALFDFEADLTAVFVRNGDFAGTWRERAQRLRVLGYTDESPNDGVVISPACSDERAEALVRGLKHLIGREASRGVLMSMFTTDGFDVPAKGTYKEILAL
jgi:phosphonate transport system substrate-binding protein